MNMTIPRRIGALVAAAALAIGAAACEADDGTSPGQEAPEEGGAGGDTDEGNLGY